VLAIARERLVGLGHDLISRPGQGDVHDLGDHARRPGQHHDPVRQVDRLVDVVRHEDDRDPELLAHPQDEVFEFEPGLRVHRRERLVHQQQVGPVGEGPRDRHPLLHAAGQLPRVLPARVGEAHRGQHLGHPRGARRAPHPAHPQRQVHVARHGQPREQRAPVVLEHHADPFRDRPQRRALEQRLSRGRRHQPGQAAQQRGLARAARPDHAGELAARHVERDVRERDPLPGRARVLLADLPQRDDRRRRLFPRPSGHRAPSTARAP
jgi:hypothetical protein